MLLSNVGVSKCYVPSLGLTDQQMGQTENS